MMSPTGRIARTIFSEEHVAFRDSVRRFIAKEITPYHARWEKDGIVPRPAWKAAGEAGLLGIAMPEAYGGLGLDRRVGAVMNEEFGRSGVSGSGLKLASSPGCGHLELLVVPGQTRSRVPLLGGRRGGQGGDMR